MMQRMMCPTPLAGTTKMFPMYRVAMNAPAVILDDGAGTGRDAAFLLKAWGRELPATTRCQ